MVPSRQRVSPGQRTILTHWLECRPRPGTPPSVCGPHFTQVESLIQYVVPFYARCAWT